MTVRLLIEVSPMSFKTILAHVDSESQAPHLLQAAVQLAEQNQAHLIGTYVAHPLGPYVARAGASASSAELAKVIMKHEYEHAAQLEVLFENATKDQNLVNEWRFDKSLQRSVSSALLEQARSVDVLLVSPTLEESKEVFSHDQIASILTHSACPIVVVPADYAAESFGQFVFLAWDGSKESSRAIFDFLPSLRDASSVWLHRVKSAEEAKRHDDDSTKDIAAALARHDISLEMSESVSSARDVGKEILKYATERGADCIVMGAYGHSRLHGLLLGNTTQYVLENSKVPLMMSH